MIIGVPREVKPGERRVALLHGREEAVFADAGYTGADKRPEHADRDVSCWCGRPPTASRVPE